VTTSKQKLQGRLQFPFEDPVESLPATAQKILAAASALLAEKGYEAVTLENVAAAAGVNKASIRYNFGNKAGLIMAVADGLIHNECLRLAADTESVPEEERLHAAMVGIRRMIVDADSFRGFFDILPHAFRDPELRGRLFALYEWWYQQNLKWLGLAAPGGESDEMLMGLAELIAAIPDGLSVQAGLNPDGFDLSRPLATLEFLLRNSMDQLLKMAAEAAVAHEAGGPSA
jgi:TetR/AcrR family acrAB operon transcriptional repressor